MHSLGLDLDWFVRDLSSLSQKYSHSLCLSWGWGWALSLILKYFKGEGECVDQNAIFFNGFLTSINKRNFKNFFIFRRSSRDKTLTSINKEVFKFSQGPGPDFN